MSVEAMAVVLHHSRASGTDKLVLLGIANHEGDGGSFPKIATLARYANVSERTVQRSIDALIAAGELVVERQAGGARHMRDHVRPNLYHVLVTCPANCDRTSHHRLVDDGDGVTPVSPGEVRGVTPVSPHRVTPVSPHRVTPVSPLNHPSEPSGESSSSSSCDSRAGGDVGDGGRGSVDVVDTALLIVAEARSDGQKIRNPHGWRATVIANERADKAAVIAQAVADGCDAVTIAGRLLGCQVTANVIARRLGIKTPPPQGDPT